MPSDEATCFHDAPPEIYTKIRWEDKVANLGGAGQNRTAFNGGPLD